MEKFKKFFKRTWAKSEDFMEAVFDEDRDYIIPYRRCNGCGFFFCIRRLGFAEGRPGSGLPAEEIGDGCCSPVEEEEQPRGLIGVTFATKTNEKIPEAIIADLRGGSWACNKAAKPTDPTNKKGKRRGSTKKENTGTW